MAETKIERQGWSKTRPVVFVFGLGCVFLAVFFVFREGRDGAINTHLGDSRREGTARKGKTVPDHLGATRHEEVGMSREPRALDIPAAAVAKREVAEQARETAIGSERERSDDAILAIGGVSPPTGNKAKVASADEVRSIKSADWNGAANLLVNALRAGDRFEVNHDDLMDFLRGKDLLGWPESLRNWIGDELMTALRQDMPGRAFEDLKSIAADSNAPAAMRDYSVQHISHLVTGGVIGKEGVDYIRATLAEADPQTLSTALISLHRLSESVPNWVSPEEVREAAKLLKKSMDERTRITAESILKK